MSSANRRVAACAVLSVLVAAACGKKGPPLAPMARVPGQVAQIAAERSADGVFVSVTVPVANVGGDQPADIARIELYAATLDESAPLTDGLVPDGWTLVASAPVRRPVASPPPTPQGAPAPPLEAGLDQGAQVTFLEVLTPELRQTSPGVDTPRAEVAAAAGPPLSLPPVHGDFAPQRRHYAASAVSRRGRRGAWSPVRRVPIGATSGPPSMSAPVYDASTLSLAWTPAPDAQLSPALPAEGLLASRPLGPVSAATKYNVYPATAIEPAPGPLGTVVKPVPLNASALDVLTFAQPGIVFDEERCFVARGVDTMDGVAVEGPASAPVCVTPRDTFPPAAPAALEAVGGAGVISLIWDAVEDTDLAGYLVLRGEGGGEPTTLLTPLPIRESSFEDRDVRPGVRYTYVVAAVDSATPPNRSAASNRAEETARQ